MRDFHLPLVLVGLTNDYPLKNGVSGSKSDDSFEHGREFRHDSTRHINVLSFSNVHLYIETNALKTFYTSFPQSSHMMI